MDRYRKGFTLLETVVVLSLMAMLAGISFTSSLQYFHASRRYEKKVVQYAVEDALVGYYGMMGRYPIDEGKAGHIYNYTLTEPEIRSIIKDLNMYVGYTFGQDSDITTMMKKYNFILNYPDKYTLKVKVADK